MALQIAYTMNNGVTTQYHRISEFHIYFDVGPTLTVIVTSYLDQPSFSARLNAVTSRTYTFSGAQFPITSNTDIRAQVYTALQNLSDFQGAASV